MTNSPNLPLDLPLHVYQVLEEEYLGLHGRLERSQRVFVRGRVVEAALDWKFHEGHVKQDYATMRALLAEGRGAAGGQADAALAEHFQSRLSARAEEFRKQLKEAEGRLAAPESQPPGDASGKDALRAEAALLRERLRPFDRAIAFFDAPPASAPADGEAKIEEVLNALLETRLYDAERFRHVTFGDTTQKLIGLYESYTATEEELVQFNRLLLEDLFPEELERVREIRLAAIFQRLHEKEQAALCLSGGGIRSGTFALGIMQGLARRNLLDKFDYLSTVSGGGYIGSWLTAWIHRHREGLRGVVRDLVNRDPQSKVDPDPPPINYLRAYSSFLTPKAGLLTADTWAFVAIYIRNLLLNWLVLFPLVIAFLLIPRFYLALLQWNPDYDFYRAIQVPFRLVKGPVEPGLRHLFFLTGAVLTIWAVAYTGLNRPGFREQLRDYYPRLARRSNQRGFIILCLVPLVLAAILLTVYWSWTGAGGKGFMLFAGLGVAVPLLGGVTSRLLLWRRPSFGEVIAVVIAGGVGGLLVGATAFIEKPAPEDVMGLSTELYACLAVPLFLLLFLLSTTLFIGLSSHTRAFNDEDREWWARFGAWLLIVALGWAVFTSLVIFGPRVFFAAPALFSAAGGLSGIVAALVGRSSRTSGNKEREAQGGLRAMLSSYLLPLLALVFMLCFGAAMSLLTDVFIQQLTVVAAKQEVYTRLGSVIDPNRLVTSGYLKPEPPPGPDPAAAHNPFRTFAECVDWPLSADVHLFLVHFPSALFILALMLLFALFGLALARSINLNLFSLHGGYRNRLIRGFLGASRDGGRRTPNPFTGFDPLDNVAMHELRPALLREVDFVDLRALAAELHGARDPQSRPDEAVAFLYRHLSASTRDELSRADLAAPPSQRMKVELMEDLNRILEEQRLEREPVFAPFAALWRDEWGARAGGEQAAARQREYRVHLNRFILERALERHIRWCDYPPHRLFHIINTSLNLVGGDNLAWQQRKAESFTISPLHSGSYRVGYRRSKDYGGSDGVSIGTAVAVSGAAASSNMGYYTTSPLLSLVMTLFNVRLGWWLGNPGPRGSQTYVPFTLRREEGNAPRLYRRASPTLSVSPVLSEALGLTNDRSKYVYLTDGGHFENLALYEMVLRRCRLIVVADGAADPEYEFGDLGSAVRKIRIDFGIPIEFVDVPIYKEKPSKDGEGGSYWAVGRICYSKVDRVVGPDGIDRPAADGLLIYVKPAVYGDEPEDVLNYKRSFADFPHESTADQFFDEPQFESHRILGSYIVDQMCHEMGPLPDTLSHADAEVANRHAKRAFARAAFNEMKTTAPQLTRNHYWKPFEEWFNKEYPAQRDTTIREPVFEE